MAKRLSTTPHANLTAEARDILRLCRGQPRAGPTRGRHGQPALRRATQLPHLATGLRAGFSRGADQGDLRAPELIGELPSRVACPFRRTPRFQGVRGVG